MEKVLHFSGGKDSLAVLWLLREEWDGLLVMWGDAGDATAEKREQMREVEALVPNFMRVEADVVGWRARNGWPTDVLSERATAYGRAIRPVRTWPVDVPSDVGPLFTSSRECCTANLWLPVHEATRKVGAKVVYRGVRKEDSRLPPVAPGQVIEGIEYRFPVYDWTEAEVLAYVGDKLPAGYARGEGVSRDCEHCTAYLDEAGPAIRNLPEVSRNVIQWVLFEQRKALVEDLKNIDEVLYGRDS